MITKGVVLGHVWSGERVQTAHEKKKLCGSTGHHSNQGAANFGTGKSQEIFHVISSWNRRAEQVPKWHGSAKLVPEILRVVF